jgi:hypothetical protein
VLILRDFFVPPSLFLTKQMQPSILRAEVAQPRVAVVVAQGTSGYDDEAEPWLPERNVFQIPCITQYKIVTERNIYDMRFFDQTVFAVSNSAKAHKKEDKWWPTLTGTTNTKTSNNKRVRDDDNGGVQDTLQRDTAGREAGARG